MARRLGARELLVAAAFDLHLSRYARAFDSNVRGRKVKAPAPPPTKRPLSRQGAIQEPIVGPPSAAPLGLQVKLVAEREDPLQGVPGEVLSVDEVGEGHGEPLLLRVVAPDQQHRLTGLEGLTAEEKADLYEVFDELLVFEDPQVADTGDELFALMSL